MVLNPVPVMLGENWALWKIHFEKILFWGVFLAFVLGSFEDKME